MFHRAHREVPEAQVQLDITTKNLTVFATRDEVSRVFSSHPASAVYVSNFQTLKLGGGRVVSRSVSSSLRDVIL